MNITCPCCHAKYSLDTALEGEAAGELQVLLAGAGPLARPLVAYLGMFRSKSRALSFDRACRLAGEVTALCNDPARLTAALVETVEALRGKRDRGDVRPLKNHNYLKQVLESVQVSPASLPAFDKAGPGGLPAVRRASKIDQAEQLLAEWAAADPLRQIIGHGLAALLALPLAKAPQPDAVDRTASLWERTLVKRGLGEADVPRLQAAFDALLSRVKEWFPVADDLFPHLPAREQRQELPEPPPNEEQIAKAKQFFSQIAGGKGMPAGQPTDPEQRRRQLREQAQQLEGEKS